jgi:hypothetical protein
VESPYLYRAIWRLKTERDTKIAASLRKDDSGNEQIYTQFGIRLQQIQAEIFIDVIARELTERDIFCYTIHDAIGCLPKDRDAVKECMERQIENAVGFKPVVKG